MNIGKFSYWRGQYLAEGQTEEGEFIALSPAVDSGMEIRYPNEVVLKVPGKTPLGELKALISLF
jgi:hypothetical protein